MKKKKIIALTIIIVLIIFAIFYYIHITQNQTNNVIKKIEKYLDTQTIISDNITSIETGTIESTKIINGKIYYLKGTCDDNYHCTSPFEIIKIDPQKNKVQKVNDITGELWCYIENGYIVCNNDDFNTSYNLKGEVIEEGPDFDMPYYKKLGNKNSSESVSLKIKTKQSKHYITYKEKDYDITPIFKHIHIEKGIYDKNDKYYPEVIWTNTEIFENIIVFSSKYNDKLYILNTREGEIK